VAHNRIQSFLQCGTEFFIFVFTSDWFLGRKDFAPLPKTEKEDNWSENERKTVLLADDFFGSQTWRKYLLNDNPIAEREKYLITLYQFRLLKWFRYALPLPFQPKANQIFHLILCSNYEAGIRATRDFYCSKTNNERYTPNNSIAFENFKKLYPDIFVNVSGRERPLEWKMLWKIIRDHDHGVCDMFCPDFAEYTGNYLKIKKSLEWLELKGYIRELKVPHAWSTNIKRYWINWKIVTEKLKVNPPKPLVPPLVQG
jgi:hypothetical protein